MKKIYSILLIIIIVLLAVILYVQLTKPKTVLPVQTPTPVTTSSPTTPAQTALAVAGMQEYTDKSFGFSFWYPTTWEVKAQTSAPFSMQLQSASTVATLDLEPIGQTYPSILVTEARSTTRTITDTGGAGPIGPITYYFDTSSHLWMVTSAEVGTTKPANITVNSMGGLHLFGGTTRFDTNIIPLSADDFVVINDNGAADATAVAKTVVALDPTVATPVSTAEQIQTIEQEKTTIQPQ